MAKITYDPDGLNIRVAHEYDTFDRLVSVINPREFTSTIQYNALDLVT